MDALFYKDEHRLLVVCGMNNKINHIHERALKLVYDDYISTFQELLRKDESVCIHHRNIQKVAVEMFKIKNRLCPEILRDIFCLTGFRSTQNAAFHRPNVNSVYNGENSFKELWSNCLEYNDS